MTALPAGYDAWRTAGPEDFAPKRPSYVPAEDRRPLMIEAGDIQIDAWGVYETDAGALMSVEINGQHFSPDEVRAKLNAMGCATVQGAWDDSLEPDELNQIAADAAGEYGDWLYEQRRDA
jgi:hypothetical protein